MTYIFLIIVLSLFFFFIYNKEKELISPLVVYTLSMIACVLCAFVGTFLWNDVYELQEITIIIIFVSVFSFALGKLLLKILIKNKNLGSIKQNPIIKKFKFDKILSIRKNQEYEYSNLLLCLEAVFVILTIIFMFSEVKRIAILSGFVSGGFSTMVNEFRELSILYTTELVKNGKGINIIVSQMRKICEVICFFNIFLLASNIVHKDYKNYKNALYLFIILLCFFLSLLTGGRMQIFIYIIAFIFIFVFLKFKGDYSVNILKKFYKQFLIITISLLLGFYILLPLFGRSTNSNIVSYISFYFGASIPSLDKYNDEEHEEPKYFGEESLRGIQNVLFKLKLSDKIQPISKEWITYRDADNNELSSNIFTSAKRYYHDFGIIGIVICQMIFGFVFELLYYLSKKSNYVLACFSMFFYMCIDQIRDELFFADFIHINTIFKVCVLLVLFAFVKVVPKRRIRHEE